MFTFSVPATNTPTHIVVWQDSTVASASTNVVMLTDRIAALENAISKISAPSLASSPSSPPAASAALDANTPLISGINMRRRDDSIGSLSALHPPDVRNILNALITPLVSLDLGSSEPMEVDHASSADADAEDADEANAEDAEEANAEDAEETSQLDDADAEDADADAEEEGIELEEFEYKGETYYKDAENLVYKMDADGDLDDQPIGIWNEEKKKVLKYSKS
jgi:pyruvate/2-oxoglutarate dehydrogenase complex dihydrolipoamide acyltransferase (E2) component